MTDGVVDVRGLRLQYQAWGDAHTAGTVVLVHGVGSSSHIWDLTGPPLADQSALRVVALDQRGHGESDQPSTGYDFPSIVADLAGFLDGVGIDTPTVLVGHSWGASVVLHFGVAHPDRTAGIVLVDGGTGSPGERWTWAEAEARLTPPDIDGHLWTELRRQITANNPAYVDPRAETVGRSLFNVDADGRVSRRFRISNHMQVVRALWEQRPSELLPRITCPLLILPARQSSDAPEWRASKVASVDRAVELQPLAHVRWFEDTVHDVPLQRPAELARELQAFAESVLAARVRA
ncbi:MAG TPA: alpha/beta hydrolase [Chloroflexota bacterium]|nr:alpha/beta hydrolase [Chloroflexota bacterium]